MIIFPAVDIQAGKAVRLRRGKKEQVTIFGDDPVDMARKWQALGAEWLHIIDLDGAFDGACKNAAIIGRIVSETGLPVQIGGGIRNRVAAANYMEAGAARLIIGTAALEDYDEFCAMAARWPGKIGVSLDAEAGRLRSRGWAADSGKTVAEVVPALEAAGCAFIVYTDIDRDGMRSGANMDAIRELLSITSLPVIAAGGVAQLSDITGLAALETSGNLEGVITGRALYEGSLDLRDAIRAGKGESAL